MFELFEVPSSVLGAIGPVASGENRDWLRQDVRPGQINLNLIIDEEVFFGVIDDPRLFTSMPVGPPVPMLPQIVTQVNNAGLPRAFYPMANRGYADSTGAAAMKPAFANFLKLRHGNPNAVYQTVDPYTGLAMVLPTPETASNYMFGSQPEAPFHSLSYPDIRYTVMRPADPQRQPPSYIGTPTGRDFDGGLRVERRPIATPPITPATTVSSPRIPPLRLFQVPDGTQVFGNTDLTKPPLGTANPASLMLFGAPTTNVVTSTTYPPYPEVLATAANPYPTSIYNTDNVGANLLVQIPMGVDPTTLATILPQARPTLFPPVYEDASNPTVPVISMPIQPALDKNGNVNPKAGQANPGGKPLMYLGGGDAANDNREHPYFRTELLQKIMNLTTVRTHQFAVWVTVGFFEVTRQGNPAMAATNPLMAYDQLGPEIGKAQGQQKRYRAFFVLDRTRATGFNPLDPGDFRQLIVYRRRIE